MPKYRPKRVDQAVERTQRTYIRLALALFLGLVVLIGACWGGYGAYLRWQESRFMRRAVTALTLNDLRTASLAARTVLQAKPDSVPACRVMAELGERTGDRGALEWRRKVVQLLPKSTTDLVALARCALQFGEPAIAEKALSEVPNEGRSTAAYHAAQGAFEGAKHNDVAAEREWAEALRLDPNDASYQLQHALAGLRSADANKHDTSVKTLEGLRADPRTRVPATRALISDSITHRAAPATILALARELKDYPEAVFGDRLLYLDVLHQADGAAFSRYLSVVEQESAANPLDLNALLGWMRDNNLNVVALDFVKTLPPTATQVWPIPMTLVQIHARVNDWHTVETMAKSATWRGLDFLRHAYLARALREQDKLAAAEHEWGEAIKGAGGNSESVETLMTTVAKWRWTRETVDLLWQLAGFPEKQQEALQTLYQRYSQTKDTGGLYRVLRRLSELDSQNPDVRNNLAQVALLLNVDAAEARKLAAEVYHKAPSNPSYATTYAYSLLTKGDPRAAVAVLNSLGPDQLRQPSISVYYGLCLAELRDKAAVEYLARAKEASLLPEEAELVERATGRLNSRVTAAAAPQP